LKLSGEKRLRGAFFWAAGTDRKLLLLLSICKITVLNLKSE
jgi:hypothetical protein